MNVSLLFPTLTVYTKMYVCVHISPFLHRVFLCDLQLSLEANTSLQVKYFNSPHGVWEPLVEPLIDPSTDNICADWSLGAKVGPI